MEDQRSLGSGISPMLERLSLVSPIMRTATFSVVALVLVLGWMATHPSTQFANAAQSTVAMKTASSSEEEAQELASLVASSDTPTATSDTAMVGPAVVGELVAQYQTLQNNNEYSTSTADAIAQQIGENIEAPVSYKQYSAADVRTESDNSYAAMLTYRDQLKDALAPIASLQQLEISIFAQYSQTNDPKYLDQLRAVAADYAEAASSSAALVVPSDAATLHAGILNAMGEFGATLEALADNANDPITVVTLLSTYQDAENAMISSFNELAQYFADHPQP